MKIDVLVAEIGSTTTAINAFDGIHSNHPRFIGQGFAKTTVLEGDVTIGLNKAIEDLRHLLKVDVLEANETFASSSAAGGLKMSVHGLVYDMTVKAAKEAALGAGANIHMITAGKLTPEDLQRIQTLQPNIILIAGGVDYGEKETALYNANAISQLKLSIPVIYAGNIVNQDAVKACFESHNQLDFLTMTQNVYPKIDVLDVEPVRKIIQNVFEAHIVQAPGMHTVRKTINQHIIPTPGAVLEASILMQKELGNLVTFDIGGATTDIHSVCNEATEIANILINPEPFAKRTVEGDLGVYVNKDNIIDIITKSVLAKELGITPVVLDDLITHYQAIPTAKQVGLVEKLTEVALDKSLTRHAGRIIDYFGAKGKTKIAEGKDLTAVQTIIATGGALTRLPHRADIINRVIQKHDPTILKPAPTATILFDNDYIMASIGVLSLTYPQAALQLMKNSLHVR